MKKPKHDIDSRIKYLNKELSNLERNNLEKQALEDDFLYEGMEGLEQISPEKLKEDLLELNKKIDRKNKKETIFPWMKIAATVSFLLVSSFIIYFSLSEFSPETENLSLNRASKDSTLNSAEEKSISFYAQDSPEAELEIIAPEPVLQKEKAHSETFPPNENSMTKGTLGAGNDAIQAEPEMDIEFNSKPLLAEEVQTTAEEEIADTQLEVQEANTLGMAQKSSAEQEKSEIPSSRMAKRKKADKAVLSPVSASQPEVIPAASHYFNFIILDNNSQPLPGISIGSNGEYTVATDENGLASILKTNQEQYFLITAEGYSTLRINKLQDSQFHVYMLKKNQSGISLISLSLSEPEELYSLPSPQGGIQNFNRYLSSFTSDNYQKGTKLELEFSITESGTLIYDTSSLENEDNPAFSELMEYLNAGPNWQAGSIENKPTAMRVQIRYITID